MEIKCLHIAYVLFVCTAHSFLVHKMNTTEIVNRKHLDTCGVNRCFHCRFDIFFTARIIRPENTEKQTHTNINGWPQLEPVFILISAPKTEEEEQRFKWTSFCKNCTHLECTFIFPFMIQSISYSWTGPPVHLHPLAVFVTFLTPEIRPLQRCFY